MKNKLDSLSPMKSWTALLGVLLIISLPIRSVGQYIPREAEPFFFFVLADTQFGMFTDNNGFEQETENFEKAIEAANRLHPAFIVVNGDLVNQSANMEQIREYKRIVAQLDPSIPIYSVPGNHDVGHVPTSESLEFYRTNFGPDYYSFQYDNLYGIVLNSMLISYPDLTPEESAAQMEWTKEELKRAKQMGYDKIMVLQHIPFFANQPDEETDYYGDHESFNIPLEQRRDYLDLFHKYGIHYIFAGHLHKNAFGRDGDLRMITTSALGMPLGEDPSGFRIVTVEGDSVQYPFYSIDSVPQKMQISE